MAALVNLRADAAALQAKEEALFACLRKLGRVIVAYSGGTDSAYLAWAAHRVLGEDAVAVTADSASIPASHKRDAEGGASRDFDLSSVRYGVSAGEALPPALFERFKDRFGVEIGAWRSP